MPATAQTAGIVSGLPGTARVVANNFLGPFTSQTSRWIPCEAKIESCG